MAERSPTNPQLDFPQLTADIIRDLRLTGQVGLLDFSDRVLPIYIVGARPGGAVFQQQPILYESAGIFDASNAAPAVNTVFADSGPLPAGDYDFWGFCSHVGQSSAATATVQLQHRDAANAANVAVLTQMAAFQSSQANFAQTPPAGITLADNERLRWQVITNGLSGVITTNIWVNRRPDL